MKTTARKRIAPRIPLGVCLAVASLLAVPTGCVSTAKIDTSAMSFSSEPLLGKIVWNDLITEDVEAVRRFYSELFGWTFEQGARPDSRPYWLARSGKVYVAGLVEVPSPTDGKKVSRWLPYISVNDVDAAITKATAAGASVAVGARNVNLGRIAAIVDSEGAVIGFARSRIGDPDDTTTAPTTPMRVAVRFIQYRRASRTGWTGRRANFRIGACRARSLVSPITSVSSKSCSSAPAATTGAKWIRSRSRNSAAFHAIP